MLSSPHVSPGIEIIEQVWPGDDPFKTDRYAILRQVKHELGGMARLYNFNASSDARSIFRYRMHTLPDEVSGPIGTSTLFWTNFGLWTEARWKLDGEWFAIKQGLRLEGYGLTGELVLDPRLNIHQQLSESLTLRQSIGRYHQPPTPGDVGPENGNPHLDSSYFDQISLGIDAKLPGEVFASLTGFFNFGTQLGVRVRDPQPGSETPEPNLGGLGPTLELLLEKRLGFAIYRE